MPKMKDKLSQKNMVRAYKAAKEGKMSIREAAMKYNIPKSTLIDKVKGKSPLECKKGPKAVLSSEEEKSLAEWGVKMAGIGYTCIRTQIMYTVKTIMDKDENEGRGRKKRFGNNNLPGKDWWGRFCERHTKLKKATTQVAERAKKLSKSDAAICKWQTSLKRFLKKQGIRDGACVFTCTANRFLVDGHRGMVKYCSAKKIREGVRYLTVLTAASANGKFVPPMIVYPGDHNDVDLLEDEAIEGTYFTKSRNGDMSVELFFSWIGNHFLDYTPTGKPIILLIPGNWSYVDMYVSRLCKDKQISLYCMPPSSNLFQEPLSWGFSRQLPLEWKRESMNFEILNPGMKVDRYAFPAVFSNVWTNQASESNIMNAFERSGIWPSDSLNKQRAAAPEHVNVQCFDEEGNAIEVAMYEEVISEYPTDVVQEEVNTGNKGNIATTSDIPRNEKANLLQQFETAQFLSEEQIKMFEARFLLNLEGEHDLVYNAWKALKELLVMKQETAEGSDDASDIDDDDSLLGWLSDESDGDLDEDNEKENIEDEVNNEESPNDDESKPGSDDDGEDDAKSSDESDDGLDGDEDDVDLSSSPSSESLDDYFSPSSRKSPSRTAMSPLKITRYVHPGAVGKKRGRFSNSSEVKKKKKKKK